MAHYAFLDKNNIVTEVIVGRDENEVVDGIFDWEKYYGELRGQRCLRTSYNTYKKQHKYGGTPFRGNFAGIGFSYDELRDAFIPPQPFKSWIFDEETFSWFAPVEHPDPENSTAYVWDELDRQWEEIG